MSDQSRFFRWVMAAPSEHQHWDNEVYWGVFFAEGDGAPFVMFANRTQAEKFAAKLTEDPDHNTDIDVSPCVVDITARNNFRVPR